MDAHEAISCVPFDTEYFGDPKTYHPAVVETPHGLLLFDVGGPGDADLLGEALESAGYAFSDLGKVIVTHHDYDHMGCLPEVVSRSGAEVVAHREAVPYVTGEEPMIKRPNIDFPGVEVDLELTDGERFRTDAGPLEVIYTPGHNPDHLVFYLEEPKVLIAADLFAVADDPSRSPGSVGNFVGPKEGPTPDMEQAFESMEPLLDLDIERTICFHGGVVDAGTAEIREIYEQGP